MGICLCPYRRNNRVNEQAKLPTRHSDKHEAPRQTTFESKEVETTAGMKNRTLEVNIGNGPSNPSGRAFKRLTDKPSQASTKPEDQRNISGDENFQGHSSSKSKTAEWQLQYTRHNGDARKDSGLSAKDAKDARISATPSTSREEVMVESVNRKAHEGLKQENEDREKKPRKTKEKKRHDDVSDKTKTEENHATDSANDIKKMHEYEKKVEILEADVIKLTQEKDALLNRQAPEGLEQQKEDREKKPRKTKEKKRHDDVSDTTKTEENHATDSANDMKKMHEYEKKVERLEADVIKLTQEKDALLNRHDDVSDKTKTEENHATDSANDIKKMHEYERKVERLEADVIKLTQEKNTLLNRQAPEVLEQENEHREKKPRKTKENERHDDVSDTTKTEENHATDSANDRSKLLDYERKVESLEADVMKLRKENETLMNRLTPEGLEEQNEDEAKKPQKTKEEKRHDEISYTTNTNENHATDLTNESKKLHEYERKVGRLEADVIKLKEEKDTLLNRLSEIGAIKLTENNPKVTDLSDENRPEKIVEQLSEIYDNEWTDGYENLTKRQCKQVDWTVKQLLDVLKETYTICVASTQEKMKALKDAISNYLGLTERDATDLDLKETKKRIQEHRKKMFQRNVTKIGEEVRDRLKKKLEKEIYECLSDYIGKCVIICWNMCTKEPPMYLDFGDWKQTAQSGDEKPANMPFDKLKFVTYTKSGDYIDYVVWPAVYICEGGPLMKKGVAQGSKLITNKM